MSALDDDALRQTPYPKQAHNDVALHRQPAAAGANLIYHIHPLALHLRTAMPAVICATAIVRTYTGAVQIKFTFSVQTGSWPWHFFHSWNVRLHSRSVHA